MKLYYNPISPYCRKVLVTLYEKQAEFEPVLISFRKPEDIAALNEVTPFGKVPVLKLDDWTIPESSIIMEYLDTHFDGGKKLLPEDSDMARRARFHDRIGDLYLLNPLGTAALEGMKPAGVQDASVISDNSAKARNLLDHWEGWVSGKGMTWVMDDYGFSFADISSACALTVAELDLGWDLSKWPTLEAWYRGVLDRASFQKAIAERNELLGG